MSIQPTDFKHIFLFCIHIGQRYHALDVARDYVSDTASLCLFSIFSKFDKIYRRKYRFSLTAKKDGFTAAWNRLRHCRAQWCLATATSSDVKRTWYISAILAHFIASINQDGYLRRPAALMLWQRNRNARLAHCGWRVQRQPLPLSISPHQVAPLTAPLRSWA